MPGGTALAGPTQGLTLCPAVLRLPGLQLGLPLRPAALRLPGLQDM